MRRLALLVVASCVLLTACTDICEVRGGPDLYRGTESFVATLEASPEGAAGTTASNATVDWDPYEERRTGFSKAACGDLVSVTIVTQDCQLQADVTSLVYETKTSSSTNSSGQTHTSATGGRFLSASATVTSGTCSLPVGGQPRSIEIVRGDVSWDDSNDVHISATGFDTTSDTITMTFDGATDRPTYGGCGVTPVSDPETLPCGVFIIVLVTWRLRVRNRQKDGV